VQRCRSSEVQRCRGAEVQLCSCRGAEIEVLSRCRVCVEFQQRISRGDCVVEEVIIVHLLGFSTGGGTKQVQRFWIQQRLSRGSGLSSCGGGSEVQRCRGCAVWYSGPEVQSRCKGAEVMILQRW